MNRDSWTADIFIDDVFLSITTNTKKIRVIQFGEQYKFWGKSNQFVFILFCTASGTSPLTVYAKFSPVLTDFYSSADNSQEKNPLSLQLIEAAVPF